MIEAKVNGKEKVFDVHFSGTNDEISAEIAGIVVEAFQTIKRVDHRDAIVMGISLKKIIDQCDPLIGMLEMLAPSVELPPLEAKED